MPRDCRGRLHNCRGFEQSVHMKLGHVQLDETQGIEWFAIRTHLQFFTRYALYVKAATFYSTPGQRADLDDGFLFHNAVRVAIRPINTDFTLL